jgi:aspartyl-tRNA(Asn)/glutamyl-tRNA(Gln) amidotransferase subunit C
MSDDRSRAPDESDTDGPTDLDIDVDIDHVAELARLTVAPEERAQLHADVRRLLAFVAQLQEVDVEGVEPMLRPVPLEDALRDDVVVPGLDDALGRLGAESQEGRLKVPRTVDKDA